MAEPRITIEKRTNKVTVFSRTMIFLGLKKPAPKPIPPSGIPREVSPAPNRLKIERIPDFAEAKKNMLEKKSERADILQKLDIKDKDSLLERTFESVAKQNPKPLDGHRFIGRILRGLDCMSRHCCPDAYKNDYFNRNSWFIERRFELNLEFLSIAYQLGLSYEKMPKITRPLYGALDKYLSTLTNGRKGITEELSSQQNLFLLMLSLNYLVMREARSSREIRQAREREKSAKRTIRLLNFELELLFKGKELVEATIRESAKDKPRVVKELIELGRFIQETEKAVSKRSASGLAEIIYKVAQNGNGKTALKIARKVLTRSRFRNGSKHISLLLKTATSTKLDRSLPKEAKARAMQMLKGAVVQIIRSQPDRAVELTAMLNYEHEPSAPQGEKTAYYQARTEIVLDLLRELPEALPLLLQERSEPRSTVEVFASVVGIETKSPVREKYESLIAELISTPAGEDRLLDYTFDYLSQDAIYSGSPSTQLKALKAARMPLLEVVQQVISAAGREEPTVSFAGVPRAQALKELIVEIAKTNDLTGESSQRLKPKAANAVILLAVKVQQLSELARNGKLAEAQTRFEELKELNQSRKLARLKLPEPELIEAYLAAPGPENRDKPAELNVLAIRSTNGNLPAALRMLEVFRENTEVFEDLQRLASNLSLNVFHAQYAYCFLAQRFGNRERTLENLRSILAEDRGGKQLLLALQKIPITIRGQSPDIYSDLFVNINEPGHVLDILVYWNLINTSGLDHRLDRQKIAKKVIEFIQRDWGDDGRLWNAILAVTEAGRYDIVNTFFRRMLRNIVERARTMDLEIGKKEGRVVHLVKDPFHRFSGDEYKAQIAMAIRAAEPIIHRAYIDPL